ncbi:hypothetical protein ACV3Z4_11860 [Clostridium perfringens]|uniref:hypothetical protein n=1 Tax=Clostridium perfringens TaxID=1502 RepID=UPI0018E41C84|nr:hypothetical protein [Clostridium perfringens]MBI6078363.1 hypothetical protein [Clostridium perfringens]MBI6084000.1 hypothetical protein [Clostridium perfringens]MBI6100384.1 hypothetical protein [Clostridium perfringens]MDM0549259.1 hypothetical protein [Clostridium perfringens]
MSKNPYLDSVIKYLKDKKFSEIINLKPNEINKFIRENKSDIISSLNLSEDNFNSCRSYISICLKAIIIINFLSNEEVNIYNKLLQCKTTKEVTYLLRDKEKLPFYLSDNISVQIRKEINSIKESKTLNIYNKENLEEVKLEQTTLETFKEKKKLNIESLITLIKNDNSLNKKLNNCTDKEIYSLIKENFNETYEISDELIDEYIDIKNSSESIEIDETINIEKVNLINKELTDRLAVLQENFNQVSLENQNLLNEKESLLAEIDHLNKNIDKYKNKSENQKVENLISMKLNTFNSLLNNNSPERQITIKDFILVNISKFIDKHNLIKTENLISQNRDLYSEMVQICLLSFMHENLLF